MARTVTPKPLKRTGETSNGHRCSVLAAVFVVVLALIGVLLTRGQHHADEACEFVGGGGDGLGFVHA